MDKKIINNKSYFCDYDVLLSEVKSRIQTAQVKANLAVNRELLLLYWNIGYLVTKRQEEEGWGTKVIERLSLDLKNELSEVKGFSVRNIKRMKAFYREYPKMPQTVAQLQSDDFQAVRVVPQIEAQLALMSLNIPWGHNILLIEKVKESEKRFWYMKEIIENGWSRAVLKTQLENRVYERQGKAITNFKTTLPLVQSDLAQNSLKDPYIFDFLTLDLKFRERELENGLMKHLQDFLMELGVGFSFVGRQYHVDLGGDDFYIDLLFYHLKLRCYIVIELKKGAFKPEYAGKLNFYLNVVDEKLRKEQDQPSIGLILCEDKNQIVAEYALRGMDKAIGVSKYELTRFLPRGIKSSLPSINEIEKELQRDLV